MDPSLFWRITPLEFSIIMDGRHQAAVAAQDARIEQAWVIAALSRMKRLPSCEELLSSGRDKGEQTPDDMLAVMKSIQASGGSVTIQEVDEKDL